MLSFLLAKIQLYLILTFKILKIQYRSEFARLRKRECYILACLLTQTLRKPQPQIQRRHGNGSSDKKQCLYLKTYMSAINNANNFTLMSSLPKVVSLFLFLLQQITLDLSFHLTNAHSPLKIQPSLCKLHCIFST